MLHKMGLLNYAVLPLCNLHKGYLKIVDNFVQFDESSLCTNFWSNRLVHLCKLHNITGFVQDAQKQTLYGTKICAICRTREHRPLGLSGHQIQSRPGGPQIRDTRGCVCRLFVQNNEKKMRAFALIPSNQSRSGFRRPRRGPCRTLRISEGFSLIRRALRNQSRSTLQLPTGKPGSCYQSGTELHFWSCYSF